MINSKVLALKYRPQEFKDLIGQEVIAQTITNSIKLGKTPNAYLLTGIRGVGKTTTARLIAKALNCIKNSDQSQNCSSEKFCASCEEIVNSNHIDILEMDAASKTGIDDVRELIENSKYSPTSASYKIYIIDEVHMLSKQAFNGLLKTLEEPPPRLKFILATTEVRKIPVTILSRCQRFDLKRVSLDNLLSHLKSINVKERGNISESALKIIARASEGSVRDAISLLDRALISQSINNKKVEIQDKDIREMLGLADRSKLIILLKEILSGNQKESLKLLKELINNGLDAKNFLNDILEILYLFNRRINLGPIEKDTMVSEAEIELIEDYSKNLDSIDLGIFWQLTIKTIEDLKILSNENLALEMYIMQLMHLKQIEKSEKILNETEPFNQIPKIQKVSQIEIENKKEKLKTNNNVKNQLKSIDQIKSTILKKPETNSPNLNQLEVKSFNDLIDLVTQNKEAELKYDLERNVRLVNFTKGKINISFNERLNKNFIKILTEKLLLWKGQRWVSSLSKEEGEKTLYEKQINEKKSMLKSETNSSFVSKVTSVFSDAKLIDVKVDKND